MKRSLPWVLATLAAVGATRVGAHQASSTTPALALVFRYADGWRVANEVTPLGHSFWTPRFPRVGGFTEPPGKLPVTALKYAFRRVGITAQVSVSVLRGDLHQAEDPVGTVIVAVDKPVRVEDLQLVGVMPVTISLTFVAPGDPHDPAVAAPSPLLVDKPALVTDPALAYLVPLTNRSDKAVRSITAITTTGQAGRSGHEGQDLIPAGGTYSLSIPVSLEMTSPDGLVVPRPLDRIVVTTVVWSDGSFAGDPRTAGEALVRDHGARWQVARIVSAFERAAAGGEGEADLAPALRALPVDVSDAEIEGEREYLRNVDSAIMPPQIKGVLRNAMQGVKTIVLGDLSSYEAQPVGTRPSVPAWAARELERYRPWLAGLARR